MAESEQYQETAWSKAMTRKRKGDDRRKQRDQFDRKRQPQE